MTTKKLSKIDLLELQVKELFGEEFGLYKTASIIEITRKLNSVGGVTTILSFTKVSELEKFLTQYRTLKYKNIC